MIIKVCGIKVPENYNTLGQLDIDMIGINFYKPSKRFINNVILKKIEGQKRVGVFVKSSETEILASIKKHQLDFAQLHGDEDVAACLAIKKHIPIIKVFRITLDFDWSSVNGFEFADYFLFDTMTSKYGGSGQKFDWESLSQYPGITPFLLSGGIDATDAKNILNISHPLFAGVDINSKFETEPGVKDVGCVKNFIKEIRK